MSNPPRRANVQDLLDQISTLSMSPDSPTHPPTPYPSTPRPCPRPLTQPTDADTNPHTRPVASIPRHTTLVGSAETKIMLLEGELSYIKATLHEKDRLVQQQAAVLRQQHAVNESLRQILRVIVEDEEGEDCGGAEREEGVPEAVRPAKERVAVE